jgi:acetoacetate decarboxylase
VRISEEQSYFMPISFGPIRPHPAGVFDDVLSFTIVYRSDCEAVSDVLPEPFEPAPDPLVYFSFQRCGGVNFLAGGSYNLVGVNVAAVFKGKEHRARGQFALVLWENNVAAIIRGRELLGIPKLFGEIADPVERDGSWALSVTENGNSLLHLSLTDTRELESAELDRLHAEQSDQAWFGWRYIPNVNGVGAALSQAQQIAIEPRFTRGWECSGEVSLGDVSWETNPTSADFVAGLRRLPLEERVRAYRTEGSVTLTRANHRVLR